MLNVPDDWGCHTVRCERCGIRYHASEGGCSCAMFDGDGVSADAGDWTDIATETDEEIP